MYNLYNICPLLLEVVLRFDAAHFIYAKCA